MNLCTFLGVQCDWVRQAYHCMAWMTCDMAPIKQLAIFETRWRHKMDAFPALLAPLRGPVDSTHRGQWRGAFMFSFELRLRHRWFEMTSRSLWRHCNKVINNRQGRVVSYYTACIYWPSARRNLWSPVDSPNKMASDAKLKYCLCR